MNINLRPYLSAAAAIAVGVAVVGCGQSTDGEATDATSTAAAESTSAAAEASTSAESATSTSGTSASGAATGVAGDPVAAIAAAEGSIGGTAYEIDDRDNDGTWDVKVSTGDAAQEAVIGDDGTVTRVEEASLDDEDRQGLDLAEISLADAITTALDETGGTLDDAEFQEDDGSIYIEVSVDNTDQGDDVDVHIDPVSGEVILID